MGEWEPDEVFNADGRDAFYWVVPASAAGRWTLRADSNWEAVVDLTQRFQRIGGTLRIKGGRTQQLLGPWLSGDVLGFTFVDSDGIVRSVRATIRGNDLEGALRRAPLVTPLKGQRRPSAG